MAGTTSAPGVTPALSTQSTCTTPHLFVPTRHLTPPHFSQPSMQSMMATGIMSMERIIATNLDRACGGMERRLGNRLNAVETRLNALNGAVDEIRGHTTALYAGMPTRTSLTSSHFLAWFHFFVRLLLASRRGCQVATSLVIITPRRRGCQVATTSRVIITAPAPPPLAHSTHTNLRVLALQLATEEHEPARPTDPLATPPSTLDPTPTGPPPAHPADPPAPEAPVLPQPAPTQPTPLVHYTAAVRHGESTATPGAAAEVTPIADTGADGSGGNGLHHHQSGAVFTHRT